MIIAVVVLLLCMAALTFALWLICMRTVYNEALLVWVNDRDEYFMTVFAAARAVMGHEFTKPQDGGGNLAWKGMLLNYTTLADMVILDQEQKQLLLAAMDHLALWELEHPQPAVPLAVQRSHDAVDKLVKLF